MHKRNYFFLLFGLIFTIFNCNKQTNEVDIQPTAVVLIPWVSDTCRVERGIDAVPESDAIRIEWIPSPEEEVAGYEIYRSIEQRIGPYDLIAGSRVLTASDSFFVDGSVQVDKRHYYYILAVTYEGVQSAPSDTLDYMLIQKAIDILPDAEVFDTKPEFSWRDPNGEASYIIRLMDVAADEYVWISSRIQSTYSDRETVPYNVDSTATLDSLLLGIEYIWRVDVVSSKTHCGSESEWVSFTVR